MNKVLMRTLVAASLVAAIPLTVAQTLNPAPAQLRERHGDHFRHGKEEAFRMPGERVEARLAYLKTALKITAEQQAQWDAFAAVVRSHARDADARIKTYREQAASRTEYRRPTAIEQLERQRQRLVARSARLGELLAVERPLYAGLTPDQQHIADQLLAERGRGGKHRGHGGA